MPKKFPGIRSRGKSEAGQSGQGTGRGEVGDAWASVRTDEGEAGDLWLSELTRNMCDDRSNRLIHPIPSPSSSLSGGTPLLPTPTSNNPSLSEMSISGADRLSEISERLSERMARFQKKLETFRKGVEKDQEITEGPENSQGMGVSGGNEMEDDATRATRRRSGTIAPTPANAARTNTRVTPGQSLEGARYVPHDSVSENASPVHPSGSNISSQLKQQDTTTHTYQCYDVPPGTTRIYIPVGDNAPRGYPLDGNPHQAVPASSRSCGKMKREYSTRKDVSYANQAGHSAPPTKIATSNMASVHPVYPPIRDYPLQTTSSLQMGYRTSETGEVRISVGDHPGTSGARTTGLYRRNVEQQAKRTQREDLMQLVLKCMAMDASNYARNVSMWLPAKQEESSGNSAGKGLKRRDRPGPRKGKTTEYHGRQNGCWNCGGDHLRRDCPQPNCSRCYRCDKLGHIARNCPANVLRNEREAVGPSPHLGTQVPAEAAETVRPAVRGHSYQPCGPYTPTGANPGTPYPTIPSTLGSWFTGAPHLSQVWSAVENPAPSPEGTISLSSGGSGASTPATVVLEEHPGSSSPP